VLADREKELSERSKLPTASKKKEESEKLQIFEKQLSDFLTF